MPVSMLRTLLPLLLLVPFAASARDAADIEAIEALLHQYRATQDAGDLVAQSRLMSPDRVWINRAGIRRTDNAANMRLQQAEADVQKKELPGLQTFTMDRDVLIRFHAGGRIAIVSFYRNAYRVYPLGTSKELKEAYGPGKETGTLVLEKDPTAGRSCIRTGLEAGKPASANIATALASYTGTSR